ncbi:MAG: 4Fe-4S dicluster domain-containing protein [Syntrophales bacterium]
MEKRLLKKEELAGVVGNLSEAAPVYAPKPTGDFVLFQAWQRGDEPLTDFGNSRDVPKQFFFPAREEIMKYHREGQDMIFACAEKPAGKSILFGVRPCDARSFYLLDMLFDQEQYQDPHYIDRRVKTTVIALACVHPPYATCFCTAVEGSPTSREGVDIMLTDLGDSYLVEFLTPKGEGWLPQFGALPVADAAAVEKQEKIASQAAREIKTAPPAQAIKPILDRSFEHAFWDTIHGKCLKCGACTYLCPTCHCFDINDETKGNDGVRIRNWDSCMFPIFTKAASGHNPRTSQKERWRQRVMHKFKYYVDNFGAMSCVGCGRCVRRCPVNIDIRKIIADIAQL